MKKKPTNEFFFILVDAPSECVCVCVFRAFNYNKFVMVHLVGMWTVHACVRVLEMLRSSDLDWCNTCFRFIYAFVLFYTMSVSFHFGSVSLFGRCCFSFQQQQQQQQYYYYCVYIVVQIQKKHIYFSIFWCIIFRPLLSSILSSSNSFCPPLWAQSLFPLSKM